MITSINHITLAVIDIKKSFAFYRDVMSFKPLVKWDKGAYFLICDEINVNDGLWFCLNVDENRKPSSCNTHYAFSVSENIFDEISAKVVASGAQIFKENTSPGDSLYFLDPDGHKLEIHVGNWVTRIEEKKNNPGSWKNITWF